MISKLVGVSAHQSLGSVTLETQWGCQPTGKMVDNDEVALGCLGRRVLVFALG